MIYPYYKMSLIKKMTMVTVMTMTIVVGRQVRSIHITHSMRCF